MLTPQTRRGPQEGVQRPCQTPETQKALRRGLAGRGVRTLPPRLAARCYRDRGPSPWRGVYPRPELARRLGPYATARQTCAGLDRCGPAGCLSPAGPASGARDAGREAGADCLPDAGPCRQCRHAPHGLQTALCWPSGMVPACPSMRLLHAPREAPRGSCRHGSQRWRRMACGRLCPVSGHFQPLDLQPRSCSSMCPEPGIPPGAQTARWMT